MIVSCKPLPAFFLENSDRKLYAVRYTPPRGSPSKGSILHIPAFCEEMNKSRAMVACQARAFARLGYDVLVVDFYGTGDSGGEFSEATWRLWHDDMVYSIGWLEKNVGGELSLWGLRLGGLMAMELSGGTCSNFEKLMLWNPVLNGEQYIHQFLRLRLANSIMYGNQKENVADLRAKLENGGSLEVAGYELSSDLYNEVCAIKAIELDDTLAKSVYWVEVSTSEKALAIPAQKVVEKWRGEGLTVNVENVIGSQFWSTQEITHNSELIENTCLWFANQEDRSTLSSESDSDRCAAGNCEEPPIPEGR